MALHIDAAFLSSWRLVTRKIHVLCQAQRGEGLAQGWRLGLPTGGKDSGAHGTCANPISDTHTQITGREVSWLHLSTFLHFKGQRTCWIQHTEHLELSSLFLLQKNCQECDDLVSSWRRLLWWSGLSLKQKEAGRARLSNCCYKEENFDPSPWLDCRTALHHHFWWRMNSVVRCLSLVLICFNLCVRLFSCFLYAAPLFSLLLLREFDSRMKCAPWCIDFQGRCPHIHGKLARKYNELQS